MRRHITLISVAAVLGATALAESVEKAGVGSIFANKRASLFESADASSKVLSHATKSQRLVYRKQLVDGDKTLWYLVQPPGLATTAWIRAEDANTSSETAVSAGNALKLVDPGLAEARPASSMTAAAHGLDDAAVKYGKAQSKDEAMKELATLESAVTGLYDDAPAADGSFDDAKDPPAHAAHAKSFAKGAK